MSVGKINELVDDAAIAQLDALYQKLGITTQAMVAGTEAAGGYITAIGKVSSISEFNAANQQTVTVMGEVKQAQEQVMQVQKQVVTATNQVVEATKAKVIAEADASSVLKKLGTDIDANVRILVEQKLQLAQVTAQIKDHSKANAADIETTAKLTQSQLLLKEAISQNTLTIRQQTKEQLAAETSNNALMAQLNQLIKLQNSLSLEERTATANGKLLQEQIDKTRASVVAANEAQGKFNDNVGNYPKSVQIERTVIEPPIIAEGNVATSGQEELLKQYDADLKSGKMSALEYDEALAAMAEQQEFFTQQTKASNGALKQQIGLLASAKAELELLNEQKLNVVDEGQLTKINSKIQETEQTIAQLSNVGKAGFDEFGNKIEKVGKGFDVTGRLANVLTSRIFRLAASFLLMTVAFGAIEWLYNLIKNMDFLTGRLDKVIQGWKTWSEVMADGNKNAGEGLAKLEVLNKAAQDNNLTENERVKAAEKMKELWPDKLKNLSDEAILNGKVADSIKAVTEEIEKQALAEAGLKKITDLESKILDEKTLQEKLENVKQHRISRVKDDIVSGSAGGGSLTGGATGTIDVNTVENQKRQIKEDLDNQIKDSKAVEDVLRNNIKIVEDNIGLGALAKSAEGKDKKPKKVIDKSWEIDYANAKAKLEFAKAQAKEILDNEQQSYDARLLALSIYIEKSNALINLERDAKNRKPGITKKEKETNNIEAETQRLGVTSFDKAEQERLNKERSDLLRKSLEDLLRMEKDAADEAVRILQEETDKQLTILDLQKNKEETALANKRKKGIIDEKEYRAELKRIADQYNIDRLGAIAFQEQTKLEILQAKESADVSDTRAAGGDDKAVEEVKNKSGVTQQKNVVAKAGIALQDAVNQQGLDESKPDNKLKKQLDEMLPYIDAAVSALSVVDQLVNQIAEAKIAALEKESEMIAQNGEAEKERIGNSILSSKEKAREQKIIDAQTKQSQLAIAAQEKKIKQDAAKFDKAANLAKAIEGTAAGVAGALPNYVLAAIVGAIGLAQVAVIAAQPLPQYFKGTKSSAEGFAHIGERGTELMIDPSGQVALTPSTDTVAYLNKGTEIIPNHELVKMLGRPEPIYINNPKADNRKVEKLLEQNNELQRKSKRHIINIQIDRWGEYSKNRNY